MEMFVIRGGRRLSGEVTASGSKNAALPILAATILTDEKCVIRNIPPLRDTHTMIELLRSLGKQCDLKDDVCTVTSDGDLSPIAGYELVSTMRGSFCVLGPMLAKLREAQVSLPGGCVIGLRPVDLHIKGLIALGAKIEIDGGYVLARTEQLIGSHIYLGGMFGSSVLATANLMMAATMAKGETLIECSACEPEIEELANVLILMGAKISGAGSPHIRVKGVKRLKGFDYHVGSDRIEIGTLILMAAATRSSITIHQADTDQSLALIDKLNSVGLNIHRKKNILNVECGKKLLPSGLATHPYPGFPTDLQAQYMALMATVPGVSVITEKVFPDRFMHIAELNRMGANIRRESASAIVQGVKHLHGAPVMASDLRASAALVLAGLAAQGETQVQRIYHLDRGYVKLDEKLKQLGADVTRVDEKVWSQAAVGELKEKRLVKQG